MESLSKTKVSNETLQTIVATAFGQSCQSVQELSDGWANTGYLLVLEDGRTMVMKAAPLQDKRVMRCEMNNMRTEVEVLRRVGRIPGLPIPQVYVYDATCSLIPAEYFIMAYMPGTPLNKIKSSLTPEQLQEIERELGMYSKAINAIQGTQFGSINGAEGSAYATWPEAFRAMIDDVLVDGEEAGVVLPASYAEIRQEIERHMHALDEVKEPALVHWDLWDGNVFVQEGRISGIIDFERAFWGDPLMEYYFGRFARPAAFERGYGRSIETEAERRRRALYDFYLDLILVIECVYRQYEDQNHISWTRSNLADGLRHLQAFNG